VRIDKVKKCKSCQKEIDDKAIKCPYCQTDLRSWFRRHPILTGILALFVFGVLISVLSGSGSTSKPEGPSITEGETATPTPEMPVRVNLRDFLAEFDNNQLAAEEKWSGKLIEFTGTISNISGSSNRPYVSFESESDEFLGASITCRTLRDSSQAVSLKNGQRVIVSGVVKDQSFGIVDIGDCVFK